MTDTPGYSPRDRVERVVSAGRLALAAFLCLTLLLHTGEPTRHVVAVRGIATGYLAYAAAIAAWCWLGVTIPARLALATHAGDLLLFAVLMHLSETQNPFFVSFVFSTLCGAIRWHGRGALVTSIVALTLYVLVTVVDARYFGTVSLDGLQLATDCGYLATIGALLACLGGHYRRLERELGSLACWPRRQSTEDEHGLRAILAHAAETLGTRRVVLVWEEDDEPWLQVAQQDGPSFQRSSEAPDTFGEIVTGLSTSFVAENVMQQPAARVVVRTNHGIRHCSGVALSPQFLQRFPAHRVLAIRIRDDSLRGWLVALDKRAMSNDDLVLGDIVGRLVAGALEVDVRLEQLRERAVNNERLRLARDLHDGVLQALTAAALQVRAARDVLHLDVVAADDRLARVQDTLFTEQQAIRRAVETLNPRHVRAVARVDGLASLREPVAAVARQWDLRVRLDLTGRSSVAQHVVHEIHAMVTEALVNAARHGLARDVRVGCETSTDRARVVVEYEGRGFIGLNGRHDLASLSALGQGPRTLMQRVSALDGSLVIESGASGARLEIDVPLKQVTTSKAAARRTRQVRATSEQLIARSS